VHFYLIGWRGSGEFKFTVNWLYGFGVQGRRQWGGKGCYKCVLTHAELFKY
jgi:hypothetical protein